MKNLWKLGLVAIVAMGLSLGSCKKKDTIDSDLVSSEDASHAEMTYDQVFKEVDGAASDNGMKKGGYPIITIDTVASPRTMNINYGTTNYLCKDGNYRRGMINVSWTGRYRSTGTIINITFADFYQNDNHVEGTKSITNNGRNASNQLSFSIVVNGKITNTAGESHTWNSSRTRTWVAGETTAIWTDDVYEITGTTSGVNRKGLNYNSNITKALRVDLGCTWRIVSGTMEVTPEGKLTRTIDFGNGACDNTVTVTINGKTYTVTRRR